MAWVMHDPLRGPSPSARLGMTDDLISSAFRGLEGDPSCETVPVAKEGIAAFLEKRPPKWL